MNQDPTPQRSVDFLIIALFLGALLIPLVLWLTQKDVSFSDVEKRALQPFPGMHDHRSITAFTHAFDSYFQDHFGLREWLIHRYQREARKRFGISGVADVVKGNDNWLYLSSGCILDDLKGKIEFSETEKELFWNHLIEKENWLRESGIAYIFLVAPNKQTIYPEFLPDHYQFPREASRLDRLLAAKPDHGGESLLDVRSSLQLEKARTQLYFKSDTHWNAHGGFIAYREILKRSQFVFPEIQVPNTIRFKTQRADMSDGDLAVMMGEKDSTKEQIPVLDTGAFTATPRRPGREITDIIPSPLLQTSCTGREDGRLRVLVLHDSFFNILKPYISESYGEVLYVTRYRNGATMQLFTHRTLKELVTLYKPDIVIEELVERNLQRFLPAIPDGDPKDN